MRPADTQFGRLVPAVGEAIGPLRRSLRRFARDVGAPIATQARVALGFSEACTFLFQGSAGDDARPGVLAVEASARDDALVVRVLSRSRTLHPMLERDGCRLTLPLVAQMADDVVIEHRRDTDGSAITMRFDLPGAVADAGGSSRGQHREPRGADPERHPHRRAVPDVTTELQRAAQSERPERLEGEVQDHVADHARTVRPASASDVKAP
jgi:anti-sigma regulatory factor (Ser/Thr protein kinase)